MNQKTKQQADADEDAIAEISKMLWEWEDSDELHRDFARRIYSYVLEKTDMECHESRATPNIDIIRLVAAAQQQFPKILVAPPEKLADTFSYMHGVHPSAKAELLKVLKTASEWMGVDIGPYGDADYDEAVKLVEKTIAEMEGSE